MHRGLATVRIHRDQMVTRHGSDQWICPLAKDDRNGSFAFRRGQLQIAPHGCRGVIQPQHACDRGQEIDQACRLLGDARFDPAGSMNHCMHMRAFEIEQLERGWHERQPGDPPVVVAEKHKYRIVVIAATFCHFDEATYAMVEQAHRVELGGALETGGFGFRIRNVHLDEAVVVFRNGEWAMVSGCLDVGKERPGFRFFPQQRIGFAEQVQIGDPPDVFIGRLPGAFFMKLDVFDAALDQGVHVGPARAAADGVDTLVAFQVVDQYLLIADERVARGAFAASRVGNASDAGPHGFCRARNRHMEVLE
ncbi:hypothetical protein SDC9_141063 [bioreactor metagenome]|uniref:Uncharacterized protein n=1 Tax=bioreactor metagenome TaxID=1076179 RepID=A0A645DX76_9ZZZZ